MAKSFGIGGSASYKTGKLSEDEMTDAQRRGMTESYPLVPPRVMALSNNIMNMLRMPGLFGEEDFTGGVQYAGGGPTPYQPNVGGNLINASASADNPDAMMFADANMTQRNPFVQSILNEAMSTATDAMPQGYNPFEQMRTNQLPFPQTKEDYDRLPPGSRYRDDGGNIYTKPMTNTAPAQPENVANVGNIGLPDDFSLMA
jgi:hypothetical protein